MTIQEAIKANETHAVLVRYVNFEPEKFLIGVLNDKAFPFTKKLIFSDWEIIPKKIEITREDLAIAWNSQVAWITNTHHDNAKCFNNLCEKLGL